MSTELFSLEGGSKRRGSDWTREELEAVGQKTAGVGSNTLQGQIVSYVKQNFGKEVAPRSTGAIQNLISVRIPNFARKLHAAGTAQGASPEAVALAKRVQAAVQSENYSSLMQIYIELKNPPSIA